MGGGLSMVLAISSFPSDASYPPTLLVSRQGQDDGQGRPCTFHFSSRPSWLAEDDDDDNHRTAVKADLGNFSAAGPCWSLTDWQERMMFIFNM